MPDNASATGEPARLTERVTLALESGDLDAIKDLLDPGARWGAPEGPHEADCQNRDQVVAWWASARAGSDTRRPAASTHHGNTKTTTASSGCTKPRSRSCASACDLRGADRTPAAVGTNRVILPVSSAFV
jgi:SnoaL-like protein